MPPRRRDLELSVERSLGDGRVVRLSARLEPEPGGSEPTAAEITEALRRLGEDLEAAVAPTLAFGAATRPDRELAELINTYRPRQRELIDLLRDEGEITPGEHRLLAAHVQGLPEPEDPRRPAPPAADRPLAAAPVAAGRPDEPDRPVDELLREYRIESLRQAGAVRARRQISYSEYMALKRHFESTGSKASASG